MSKQPKDHPSLRGAMCRLTFHKAGIRRPMSIIEGDYPNLTEEERQAIRQFLCCRASAKMPERLMRIAEKAAKMYANTVNA